MASYSFNVQSTPKVSVLSISREMSSLSGHSQLDRQDSLSAGEYTKTKGEECGMINLSRALFSMLFRFAFISLATLSPFLLSGCDCPENGCPTSSYGITRGPPGSFFAGGGGHGAH
jgi:hypothetical protein